MSWVSIWIVLQRDFWIISVPSMNRLDIIVLPRWNFDLVENFNLASCFHFFSLFFSPRHLPAILWIFSIALFHILFLICNCRFRIITLTCVNLEGVVMCSLASLLALASEILRILQNFLFVQTLHLFSKWRSLIHHFFLQNLVFTLL